MHELWAHVVVIAGEIHFCIYRPVAAVHMHLSDVHKLLIDYCKSRNFHVRKFQHFKFLCILFSPPGKAAKMFCRVRLGLRAHTCEVSRLFSVRSYSQFYLRRFCHTAFQMESCVRHYFNTVFTQVCIRMQTNCSQFKTFCMFNFRHLSNWRKFFTGENFPIYTSS